MKVRILTMVAIATLLVSCGKKAKKEQTTEPAQTEQTVEAPKTEEPKAETEAKTDEIKLEIAGTDQMTFDKAELKVKAGQKVTLTLKHSGKMAKSAMGHNWVLLKQGTDIPAFAEKAIAAKDTDYIPAGSEEIIAHTKLVGGAEGDNKSDTITFTAPEKGTYDYICSFPGHYSMMKGKLIVE